MLKGWSTSAIKMMKIVFCVVLSCSRAVFGEITDSEGAVPMPTMSPAIISNITISPSVKLNYTLELSNCGPSVLDSTISFKAVLRVSPNHTEPEGEFLYLWLNNANQGQDRTKSKGEASLLKTFDGTKVNPGEYLMTVVVSPKEFPRDIVTFGSTVFRLTKRLNGNLKVKQNLEYQRRNNTFAIDKEIDFHVNLTDDFKKEFPQYMFFWYNRSQLIHSSQKPKFEMTFSQPTVLFLQAEATVDFLDSATPLLAPHDKEPKYGTFQEKLLIKESLSNCSVTRVDSSTDDQSVKLGDAVILNIVCNGSAPSAVCWNITNINVTLNQTCRPPDHFENKTHHQVSVSIGSTGWNAVHLTVFNDVTRIVLSQNFYVYDADTVNIPALVFPIVFIVLGLTIAAAGGAYIVRLRRRLHVEVADFDFSPNISVRTSNLLSPVASAVKQFFSRLRHWRNQSRGGSERSSTGEIRRSTSLYESL